MITTILGTAHQKSILGKGSPDGKFKEYKYSREVCKAVSDTLKDMGYPVFIDVEADDLGLPQAKELATRCKIVNDLVKQHKDCIYVSIHVNAAASDGQWHNGTGWEVYTTPGKTKADDLATHIFNAAKYNLKDKKLRTDLSDGDPDKEANLYVLKHTNCPAVLTENFFQDNKDDVKFLLSDEGKKKIIDIHVNGIINYIKNEL